MKKAIILTDGKAGHENQSRAFARALGCEAELVRVDFRSRFAKFLSYVFDRAGLRTLALFKPCKWPEGPADVVIGTGSGTFYAAKALARKIGSKCAVVLYPRSYDIKSFDCIVAPAFDNPPRRANVITIPVNLVASDEAFYDAGVKAFREHYAEHRSADGEKREGAVAVIIGGPNKNSTMTAEWVDRELKRVFAETPDCEHWVTTSRRTPKDVEEVVDRYPFEYKLIYSRDHFNPIPAFVKLADRLYVTAESTGMLSEACTFGTAEVFALDDLNPGPHKFRRFVEGLRAGGYVDGNRKIDLSAQFAAAARLLGPTQ